MPKNNHNHEELTVSLDELFSQQFVVPSESAEEMLEKYLGIAAMYSSVESCISVLSDLKTRQSYIFYGALGDVLDIAKDGTTRILDTIWEEEILCRIPESDLNRKREEEIKFFTFVKRHPDSGHQYYLSSSFPMQDSSGKSICVRHRIFYFHVGKEIRYALCLYNAAQSFLQESVIVNSKNGEELPLYRIDSSGMLSSREREVLSMISMGLSSKEISTRLNISLFTVNRHRQNIISKMNVKNSSQACQMAHQMGLI